jgi:aminomethyltransferase
VTIALPDGPFLGPPTARGMLRTSAGERHEMGTGSTAFEGATKTPLFAVHQQYGAKMGEFSGWVMPLEYAGTLSEHRAVREDVGVFDVSHLGKLWITGEGAERTIASSFTNDPYDLGDGESQYTLCCGEDGGIVDDLIVYRLHQEHFLAVPNAANTATVREHLRPAADEQGAEVRDATSPLVMLALQGPRALDVAHALFPDASSVPFRGVFELELGPSDHGWLCRTGYTGEPGVEILLPSLDAAGYFRRIVEEHDVTPVGLGARDTLRLEMGYPLHGQDLTPETDPYAAQLGWAVDLDRRPFRGQDALRRMAEQGPSRRLWGLRARGRGIPRPGMTVTRDGAEVGEVTSGTFSPVLEVGIGLGYLAPAVGPGDSVTVDVRGRDETFEVVRPPFVDADPRGER